jgi:hypothetical protein
MANQNIKKIGNEQPTVHTWRENWEVMKPFVHFSIKAMGLVAGALIGIIKLLPILLEHKEQKQKKDKKVINI